MTIYIQIMAYKPNWEWLPGSNQYNQSVNPVIFAIEGMKVVPMCTRHHRDLHLAEDLGMTEYSATKYDILHNPFYKAEIRDWRDKFIDSMPPPLKPQVYDGMLSLMEFQKLPVAALLR